MKDPFVPKNTGIRGRSLDEISADFSLLGVSLRKQLEKLVLRVGGAWATIAFKFVDFNKDFSDFGDPEIMLATFKSDGEFYKRQNYFIIKDKEMAKNILKILKEWFNIESS